MFNLFPKKKKLESKIIKISDKRKYELQKESVDQEHYLFLLGLEEGSITEKQYDKWVHSRKKENPELFKKIIKRPYKIRRL